MSEQQTTPEPIDENEVIDSLLNKSKVVFGSLPEQVYAQLKVVLIRDKIKRHVLFSTLIEGYINDEPEIRKFINRMFAENFSKKTRKKKELVEETKQYIEEALSQVEIENIYDFLENEDYFEF